MTERLVFVYWLIGISTSIALGLYHMSFIYGAAIWMGFGIIFIAVGSIFGKIATPTYRK